jgi:crossover junction endodeoxyribonuclease RuvC
MPDAEMNVYSRAVMEHVSPMPGEGTVSAFTFGRSVGIVQGVLHALRIPFEMVTPKSWKKAMMPGAAKDKGQSIVVVKRLLPSASDWIKLQSHHGRSDALLIALYGLRKYQKGEPR